jgi:hypothetical protein
MEAPPRREGVAAWSEEQNRNVTNSTRPAQQFFKKYFQFSK